MNTLRPITIRAAQLTSSTVTYPAASETAWTGAAASYAIGATVSYTVNGLIQKFESKTAHTSTATNFPVPYPNETVNWLDLGAVNRYNMFQLERNTQTASASPLVVEINPGERVGMVALGNLDADSVTLDVYSGATLVSTEERDLVTRLVTSWFDYFYQPFLQVENTLFTEIPVNTAYTHKLTFTRAAGNVSVGFVVMGMPFEIGKTQLQAEARRLNFSTIDRDVFGETKITVRRSVPKTTQQVFIDKPELNSVVKLVDDLNGVVTVWSVLVDPIDGYFNTFFLIGFYRDVRYVVTHPETITATFELEAI